MHHKILAITLTLLMAFYVEFCLITESLIKINYDFASMNFITYNNFNVSY